MRFHRAEMLSCVFGGFGEPVGVALHLYFPTIIKAPVKGAFLYKNAMLKNNDTDYPLWVSPRGTGENRLNR